jgi:hypothetical protein
MSNYIKRFILQPIDNQYIKNIFNKRKWKIHRLALVIYTGTRKPAVYNCFKMSHFGTKLTYEFNAYIVREQKVADLMASDNPFSVAVLAALYMIKAGKNDLQKLEFKKKMVEIALKKNFDKRKLFRLLNFVAHLMTLPKSLESEFKNFTQSPKIQEEMNEDILETVMLFGGRTALDKMQQEARVQEREKIIMNAHHTMGFSAEQIAKFAGFDAQYVQSVIDKFEKKE